MADVPTLFFDVGGVLLTNGWDTGSRRAAAETFGLDYAEFQTRHEMLKTAFETGHLSLDGYVRKAVFHRERSFTSDEFKAFMFSRSKPLGDTLDWVRTREVRKCRLFTSTTSRGLHEHRSMVYELDKISRILVPLPRQAKPDEGIHSASDRRQRAYALSMTGSERQPATPSAERDPSGARPASPRWDTI